MGDAASLMGRPTETAAAATTNKLFWGTFIHSTKLDELEYLHDTAVCVDGAGKIVAVERGCDLATAKDAAVSKLGWDSDRVVITSCQEGQFFFPGFIGE